MCGIRVFLDAYRSKLWCKTVNQLIHEHRFLGISSAKLNKSAMIDRIVEKLEENPKFLEKVRMMGQKQSQLQQSQPTNQQTNATKQQATSEKMQPFYEFQFNSTDFYKIVKMQDRLLQKYAKHASNYQLVNLLSRETPQTHKDALKLLQAILNQTKAPQQQQQQNSFHAKLYMTNDLKQDPVYTDYKQRMSRLHIETEVQFPVHLRTKKHEQPWQELQPTLMAMPKVEVKRYLRENMEPELVRLFNLQANAPFNSLTKAKQCFEFLKEYKYNRYEGIDLIEEVFAGGQIKWSVFNEFYKNYCMYAEYYLKCFAVLGDEELLMCVGKIEALLGEEMESKFEENMAADNKNIIFIDLYRFCVNLLRLTSPESRLGQRIVQNFYQLSTKIFATAQQLQLKSLREISLVLQALQQLSLFLKHHKLSPSRQFKLPFSQLAKHAASQLSSLDIDLTLSVFDKQELNSVLACYPQLYTQPEPRIVDNLAKIASTMPGQLNKQSRLHLVRLMNATGVSMYRLAQQLAGSFVDLGVEEVIIVLDFLMKQELEGKGELIVGIVKDNVMPEDEVFRVFYEEKFREWLRAVPGFEAVDRYLNYT